MTAYDGIATLRRSYSPHYSRTLLLQSPIRCSCARRVIRVAGFWFRVLGCPEASSRNLKLETRNIFLNAISRRIVMHHAGRRSPWRLQQGFIPLHLTQDRCVILSTIAANRNPFNRTAAARRRRSGIDVRRSVHASHGTERVSMPSSGEIRTVELTRGRETGATILPYAPWHFLYFFPLPQGQGSLRPTLSSLC